jgi:hypothetical protein
VFKSNRKMLRSYYESQEGVGRCIIRLGLGVISGLISVRHTVQHRSLMGSLHFRFDLYRQGLQTPLMTKSCSSTFHTNGTDYERESMRYEKNEKKSGISSLPSDYIGGRMS